MACNCPPGKITAVKASGSGAAAKPKARPAFISVRYSGPTSALATGASGRRYEFKRTGVVMQVDARDGAMLAKVPHLRRV